VYNINTFKGTVTLIGGLLFNIVSITGVINRRMRVMTDYVVQGIR
jgi:hypothetical protein